MFIVYTLYIVPKQSYFYYFYYFQGMINKSLNYVINFYFVY